MTPRWSLVGLLILVGCGDPGSVDAGMDAGARADAGSVDAGSGSDAGARADAGADAGAPADAGADAGARADAGAGTDAGSGSDAGAASCLPSAVRSVPPGMPFMVGVLCDDVFVCVDTMAEADAVVTASGGVFTCSMTTGFPCSTAYRCQYQDPGGPSTVDMTEYDRICAVTVLSPTPDVVCVVYL